MTVPSLTFTEHASAEEGPVLVLGPSLGSDGAVLWETTIPLLRDRFRIVSWDLPGHGASRPTTEPFSLADLADAVARHLDDAGVARVFYAGVSIGGAVALELGLRHADRIAAAAIICSAARIGSAEAWHERAALVRSQSTSALIVPSAERWFAPGMVEAHPDIVGRLLHALQDADDESYALACEALAAFDVRDRLGEIAVPILGIWGDVDPSTPKEQLEEIAAGVQHGRAIGIERCAHLATADQPEAVAAALREFFA